MMPGENSFERPHNGIRAKLYSVFILLAVATAVLAAVAISEQMAMARRAALLEAENVALTIAQFEGSVAVLAPENFQADIEHLMGKDHRQLGRDITLIDLGKRIRADIDDDEVGDVYTADKSGAIDRTLKDGVTRMFTEPAAFHRNAHSLEMIVVPLHQEPWNANSPVVGAILVEYTPFYARLMAKAKFGMYLTAAAGVAFLVLIFGLANRMVSHVVRPLIELKDTVRRFAAGHLDTRVAVSSDDEIGELATAFNGMAEQLQAVHRERVEYERELEQRIADRVRQIEFLAYHDSLTSLPNRSLFSKLLTETIEHARRDDSRFAVLFIDLDRFKNINDSLGHEAGDQLLQEAGARIKQCLRATDIVARLGGDEFVVVLPGYEDEEECRHRAGTVANKIMNVIAIPFVMMGKEFRVTASIGISTYPDDGEDEITLTKNADIAMYQAKDLGKNNYQFYSERLHLQSFELMALESSLRRAMEHNEFELHYQAKASLATGALTGMEVLIRWQHPELGMIPPAKFIAVAEEIGLIVDLGKWVLETACTQNRAWHAAGLPQLPFAVNLSARQFGDDRLLEDITAILHETGMNPSYLELEITESMIMHDVDKAIKVLGALKMLGVRVAIDDFGTGYSSLSTLERFPVDTIKIDRSFIRDLPDNATNKAITQAIITMGKHLGMTVVAEGVETDVQRSFLRDNACDQLQGYLFNRPMPADQFADFIRQATAGSAAQAAGEPLSEPSPLRVRKA